MPNKPIPKLAAMDVDRFWSKVEIQEPTKCWPWLGHKSALGYGRIDIRGHGHFLAPRIAYFISTHHDAGHLNVLHKCDNPSCCNPAHLFVGSNQDNVNDREAKGRNKVCNVDNRGIRNRGAKLTETDVISIRREATSSSHDELSRKYSVNRATINRIINGKLWRHI